MATLYDGVPVFAPAAGNTALASDQVTLQAKLILGLEARWTSIPITSGVLGDAGGWALNWTIGGAPDVRWSTSGASSEILFPMFPRDGEYLTDAEFWLMSTAGAPTGGSIAIYKEPLDGTAGGSITTFGAAGNFWDTDGVVTKYSAAAINIELDTETNQYFVGVLGPTAGVTTSYIYGIHYKTQFHIGA